MVRRPGLAGGGWGGVGGGALSLDFLNSASFSVVAHPDSLSGSKRIVFRKASQLLTLLLGECSDF